MAGVDRRVSIRTLLQSPERDAEVIATGWVKTSRFSKNVSFIHLFDGSTPKTLQVVLSEEVGDREALKQQLGVGTAVRIVGTWVESPGAEQAFEVAATDITIVGASDASTYPLRKQRTSFEHLRTIPHLRTRSNTLQAVIRVRNALAWNIHKFFQDRGFVWVHTPILTSADAEGAGEMFAIEGAEDFFGQPAFLTVSGQLDVECVAQSHTDVYTFGPTFRAENSNTARHVAEFWMIEPEMAFANLDDVIAVAEDFVREVTRATLAQCPDDFAFFDRWVENGLLDSLRESLERPFARMTYAEAQDILLASGESFEFPVGHGESLQSEHEQYLAEVHVKGPVFITDYPVDQKAFYMRLNDDGTTVAATDLLVPRIGEVIGGSQREERLDVLTERIAHHGIEADALQGYLDLRRWGSTPHGGFGLGFERLLMWMTGMKNIRDVVVFPRAAGTIL